MKPIEVETQLLDIVVPFVEIRNNLLIAERGVRMRFRKALHSRLPLK